MDSEELCSKCKSPRHEKDIQCEYRDKPFTFDMFDTYILEKISKKLSIPDIENLKVVIPDVGEIKTVKQRIKDYKDQRIFRCGRCDIGCHSAAILQFHVVNEHNYRPNTWEENFFLYDNNLTW